MSYWSGTKVIVGWLVKQRRTLHRLARKVGVCSLIAVMLYAVCSTADDFHTCTLHRPSFTSHSLQFSSAASDDQFDRTECLARQWRVVSNAVSAVELPGALQLLHLVIIEPENSPLFHIHTSWQDRAPPFSVSFRSV